MSKPSDPPQADLSAAQSIYDQAIRLARRWVAAWPQSAGYSYNAKYINEVQLHWGDGRTVPYITFSARPDTSGAHNRCSMPMSYLTDSSTLEADSLAAYETDRKARHEKAERIKALRSNPEVIEYLTLTNTYPYQNQIWL
jgi:hypothetical protein